MTVPYLMTLAHEVNSLSEPARKFVCFLIFVTYASGMGFGWALRRYVYGGGSNGD